MSMTSKETRLGLVAAAVMTAFTWGALVDEAQASTLEETYQTQPDHDEKGDVSLPAVLGGLCAMFTLVGLGDLARENRQERKSINNGNSEQKFRESLKYGYDIHS